MEFKGTPGPWKYQLSQTKKDSISIIGSLGHKFKVARVPFMIEEDGITPETAKNLKQEAINDAKLIAAAPKLLAFAIDFVNKVESGRAKSTDSYNKAKDAISEALGKE